MIKQNFEHIFFSKKLKLLFPKGHNYSSRKKGLNYSLEQLKLLLPGNMIVFFEEKPTSSGYNEISLGKCPKEHMF
jgi:hypothetical protein